MSAKVKVSLTLAADLVASIDRDARRTGTTRSYLVEQRLRDAATRAAERSIETATDAYYASLTGAARDEERAIASASTSAAKTIRYDALVRKPTRRSR